MKSEYLTYLVEVVDYLEYLEYNTIVLEFEPEDVARSLAGATRIFFEDKLSPRFCALSIFGLTMHYQVMSRIQDAVKH